MHWDSKPHAGILHGRNSISRHAYSCCTIHKQYSQDILDFFFLGIKEDKDYADLNNFKISFGITSAKYKGAEVLLINTCTQLNPFLSE